MSITGYRLALGAMALSFIALGIAWRHIVTSSGDDEGSGAPSAATISDRTGLERTKGSDSPPTTTLPSKQSSAYRKSDQSLSTGGEPGGNQPDSRSDQSSASLSHNANESPGTAQDPVSEFGLPFPLSDSVIAECKWLESRTQDSGCPMLRQALTRLEQEPRDAGWASAMEQQIRDYLEAKQPGENPIRALECRTAICAIECAAPGSMLCHLEYEFTRRVGLLEHGNASGFETDKSGARIVVTVEAFERREPLK